MPRWGIWIWMAITIRHGLGVIGVMTPDVYSELTLFFFSAFLTIAVWLLYESDAEIARLKSERRR